MTDLPPGPELDALVAEKVMGLKPGVDFGSWPEHDWKRDEDGEIAPFGYDGDTHNGPQCTRCHHSYCEHCHPEGDPYDPTREVRPPAYSTAIIRAWQVVERLDEVPSLWKPVVRMEWYEHDGCGSVRVVDRKGGGDGVTKTSYHSLPHAICLAALAAVGGGDA